MHAHVENHFYPWFILFKKEKKPFRLKLRKTYNKTLSLQELLAYAAASGLFAVCREVVSFVVCKMTDVPQTNQTEPPASLRRLKEVVGYKLCYIKTLLRTRTISSHLDLLTLGQYS